MNIRYFTESDKPSWDAYVQDHPNSTNCHLAGWKDVIEEAYGHRTYYLLAEESSKLIGILPLVQVKSFIFGNNLVSMPFLNYGGILADNGEVEEALLAEALELSKKLKAKNLELRHLHPLQSLSPADQNPPQASSLSPHAGFCVQAHKVRMVLELPATAEDLWNSFKAKLRSQINRPIKEGMETVIGGKELLGDFYHIFAINMRDLGSPVHSKSLFRKVKDHLGDRIRIVIVRHQGLSVAGALIVRFRDTVEVPWASSLRKYNSLSPNMLLYWALLKFACDQGCHFFDFGRSTPGEGTEKFKAQWGAKPQPLYWYSLEPMDERKLQVDLGSQEARTLAENVWRRFPVVLANLVGPRLRAGIPL